MPIITGDSGDFGRLVAEEFDRRARRVVELGQASRDPVAHEAAPGGDETAADLTVPGDLPEP